MEVIMNSTVLVLNQNYIPLHLCSVRRAVVLIHRGKAEMVEAGLGLLRSPRHTFPYPSVIRLGQVVKPPLLHPKLTRRQIFIRDKHTCQYCGTETRDLTLDHVTPRYLGGRHAWENLVSACKACNRRKGGHTPEQAHMKLLRPPTPPKKNGYFPFLLIPQIHNHPAWLKFFPLGTETMLPPH
ncbi:MAG: HNH endonuclease [Chloroflexi bacterium]|nr:HNH endonuclease [Chloroflexota bacterium]